ncbi:MAG: Hpt domain-containing protein, partial [Bacteroidota bacterium]
HVPIVACSAHALESEKQRCLSNGMNDYITKPYNESEMVRTLARYGKRNSRSISPKSGDKPRLVTSDEVMITLSDIEKKEGKGFARTLISMFNQSAEGLIDDISRNLREKSWDELQKKAHYTAGVLSNFPFMEGVNRSRHLEKMLKERNVSETEKAATELIDYLGNCK